MTRVEPRDRICADHVVRGIEAALRRRPGWSATRTPPSGSENQSLPVESSLEEPASFSFAKSLPVAAERGKEVTKVNFS